MRGDRKVAGAQLFSILQFVDVVDRSDWRDHPDLRVALSYSTFGKHSSAPRTRHHAGTAQSLQFRDAAGVIEVYVRVHDQLDVFDSKTETPDVGDDLRDGLRQVSVNQNVAAVGRDQDGT